MCPKSRLHKALAAKTLSIALPLRQRAKYQRMGYDNLSSLLFTLPSLFRADYYSLTIIFIFVCYYLFI
jgi:hypothetical protein